MNKRIESHIDTLLKNAGGQGQISDIREELLSNLNDKYNDLVSSGKSDEEAFALVISGIGDVDSLLKDLGQKGEYQPLGIEEKRQKRGLLLSIGIALYVLSIVPIFFLGYFFDPNISIALMLMVCAGATGFVVYGNIIGKVNYNKADDSFVEEYKEKVAETDNRKKLRGAISAAMWPLIVVIYLALSFFTGWWHVTWILFVLGGFVEQIIEYKIASQKKRKKLWHGFFWTGATIVYFIISFAFRAWAWSWIVFILAAAIEQIVRAIGLWKNKDIYDGIYEDVGE